jgi:crotonobetainyl-CoA:carnitine CoA-transferase CaiB-like acyl-CoA transferase
MMSKALEDVVVLDLTTQYWASVGAALLADFGARVIRVETGRGEREIDPGVEDRTPWDYEAELSQRNKLSLALDVENETGRGILRDLAGKVDVLMTDWALADLERLGLDYASLNALRPDIIYTRGSGFGPKGPDRDLPALDELAAARTGMMPILPQPGQPPVYADAGQMYTAVMLAFGAVLALRHRQETGEGQEVDASLFASNMYGASLDVQAFLAMGGERFLHPVSRLDAGNPMSGVLYPSSDDRWVCLTMPDTDRWWPGLAEIVDLDVDDPLFNSHEKRCGENRLMMMQVLEERFHSKPADHWKRVLTEKQLSADIIEGFDYPANDPQAHRNRYVLELDRPGVGRVKTLGFPIHMSETPARLDRMAPARGQHSAEILHELLGYSEARIAQLEESGVIG